MSTYRPQIIEIIEPYFAEWQTEVDITAVLNYIAESKNKKHMSRLVYDNNSNYFEVTTKFWSKYKLLNKPLHLYIEREEKHLLELLRTLWTQS
jgi:hypothetical protein